MRQTDCCTRYVERTRALARDRQLLTIKHQQCIAANFVSGSIDPPSACKNASITASFVNDSKLTALVSGSVSGSGSSSNSTGGTSSSTPSSTQSSAAAATTSGNAAPGQLAAWSVSAFGLGSALTAVSMVLAGGALTI